MIKDYNDLGVEFKYLIVNDMDRKYGLWVNTVGFQSIPPNSPYPLHRPALDLLGKHEHAESFHILIRLAIRRRAVHHMNRKHMVNYV